MNIYDTQYCVFSHIKNAKNTRYFKLIEDGKIQDINSKGHDNERFWSFIENEIILYSINKEETSRFKLKESGADYFIFEGLHKGKIPLRLYCFRSRSDLFLTRTKWTHREDIERGFLEVGDNTYGSFSIFDKQYGKIIIGNFCSIASGVKFIVGNHRMDLMTTYPFKTLRHFYTDEPIEEHDHFSKGNIVIGNDVWIGNNAQIMSGVKIGDGAVIAANAIVTKDVEPYSIVGGNPAKHIKYRIEDAGKRQKMLKIAWWNWSNEIIVEHINKIMSADIDTFIIEFS